MKLLWLLLLVLCSVTCADRLARSICHGGAVPVDEGGDQKVVKAAPGPKSSSTTDLGGPGWTQRRSTRAVTWAPMQGKLRSRCGSGHHLRGLLSHPRQKARSPARRSSILGAAAETWRRRQKAAALAEPANTLARSRGRVSYGARNGVPQSCRSMPATDPRCKPFQAASRAVARLGSGPPMDGRKATPPRGFARTGG